MLTQARAPSTQLPFDIWPQVLGHLSGRARIRVRQVCTIFSQFHPGEQVIVASRLATPNASPSLLRFLTMLSQQRGIKLRLYLDMGSRRYNLRGAPPGGRRNDPHLWSVINAGVQSAGLTSLSLCLHLSLAEGRLILSALPTSLRKLVLEADAQIVTEERWQRLESLVSVELTLPYMGGQPSMPVYEPTGLGSLPALRELGLHGDWRCLEPTTFVMPTLQRLWFDENLYQPPYPTASQLPALSEVLLPEARACPRWLEEFPLHRLGIDSWRVLKETHLSLLRCTVLRIAPPAGEQQKVIPLWQVMQLPDLTCIEIGDPRVESDGLPVVFEGQTQEQVDRFNADISLQSCGAANAVVRCSDHASCIMHDDYLQDALQPDVLRLFLLPDVGCVIIG